MKFIPADDTPVERTNITHRFKLFNAFAVKLHKQNEGVWLLDVETMKNRDITVSFVETFDLEEMVDQLEKGVK